MFSKPHGTSSLVVICMLFGIAHIRSEGTDVKSDAVLGTSLTETTMLGPSDENDEYTISVTYSKEMMRNVRPTTNTVVCENTTLKKLDGRRRKDSGVDDVEQFATVINFYLTLENMVNETYEVEVIPEKCCLEIDVDDIDCEVMILRPPAKLELERCVNSINTSATATFMFRNLAQRFMQYARYRKGYCDFLISVEGNCPSPSNFKHVIHFDTYPTSGDESNSTHNCSFIDQDPERFCTPVDCAIKYKGKRNFYRNETGKCEPVVECDTRGSDGISIVAYYDWENNVCHELDLPEENEIRMVETRAKIPSDLDPSQNAEADEFDIERLKELSDSGKISLKCNHGVQNGIYCDCDNGWMSSGVHEKDPLTFHWCDTVMAQRGASLYAPRKLSKPVEVLLIIILLICNMTLFVTWVYLAYKVFKDHLQHILLNLKTPIKYTALKPHDDE